MFNKSILPKLLGLFLITSCGKSNIEYKYPQSFDDKQFDRVGTLGKGLSYTYSAQHKSIVKQNKNWQDIWQSAIATLEQKNILLNTSDATGGLIISDWHYINDNKRIKLNLFLKEKGNIIELKVKAMQQTKAKDNNWSMPTNNQKYADSLKKSILGN
jgi:uncharacterized lipoprotein